jgi:hypothetical protein
MSDIQVTRAEGRIDGNDPKRMTLEELAFKLEFTECIHMDEMREFIKRLRVLEVI